MGDKGTPTFIKIAYLITSGFGFVLALYSLFPTLKKQEQKSDLAGIDYQEK